MDSSPSKRDENTCLLEDDVRVGIIGAGIAGAAASYFLRKEFGDQVEIVVFEGSSRIGGRIQEVNIGAHTVGVGAKMIHSGNRYLTTFVEELNLPTIDVTAFRQEKTGIWNGQTFDFITGYSQRHTRAKMLFHYGVTPIRLRQLLQDTYRQFRGIYECVQDQGPFSDPGHLLETVGLKHAIHQSGYEHFAEAGLSPSFVHDQVNALSRAIYGQDADMHVLGCLTPFIAMTQVGDTGSVFRIDGGNSQLCIRLLEASDAKIRTDCRVHTISQERTGSKQSRYRVRTKRSSQNQGCFDAVIIAAPLECANIDFANISLPPSATIRRPYQDINVTVVAGELNPEYFNRDTRHSTPPVILTKETPSIPFLTCIQVRDESTGGDQIYKLTSRNAISTPCLNEMFTNITDIRRKTWQAYPKLNPGQELPPFEIQAGLYYVNAMESIISTMETEVVSSRNIVNLLTQRIGQIHKVPLGQKG